MSAVAEPIARPQQTVVPVPVATPAPAPAKPESTPKARGEYWVVPFAITLAGSLALFAEQIAQYTSLL